MKVLLLTDADVFAGTERHMLALAAGMRERGVDAYVGCPAGTPLAQAAKAMLVPVVAIEKHGAIDVKAIRRLVRLLRHEGFDLIHAHNGRAAWLASIARVIARRGMLVSTMHFIAPARSSRSGLKRWAGHLAHRLIRSQTRAIIAISDAVRSASIARGDLSAADIHRVHNGVLPPPSTRDPRQVRPELCIDARVTVFLAATRLEKEKCVPLLLDAAALVKYQGGNDFKILVVGGGAMHDELRQRIESLGLQEHVQLLGFRDDVHDLMAAADVLVHPAKAEPFGLVLIEAMALGLPVIASNGGAAPEIVRAGETGWVFQAESPEGLARSMTDAILAGPRRKVLGEAGRARFNGCFTADRMTDQTLAVYREALSEFSSPDISAQSAPAQ